MGEAVVMEAPPTFEEYVALRGAGLWRSAWLLTGDAQRAEDLVQTALAKCWRRWDTIARDGAVDGYVRRVLVTTYTDWRRRRWNGEVPAEPGGLAEAAASPDLAVRRDVLRALARLPRGQRAVIVLRYYEDLTEAQTAAALGVSVGTVKSQASRALATLRASAVRLCLDFDPRRAGVQGPATPEQQAEEDDADALVHDLGGVHREGPGAAGRGAGVLHHRPGPVDPAVAPVPPARRQ